MMRGLLILVILPLLTLAADVQRTLPQTTEIVTQAQRWGLTQEEWTRYQQLMKSERGIWSPGIDPLTALGVEANNAGERKRYAEMLARREYQRVEKELAFQRAYDDAWKRLYPTLTKLRDSVSGRIALLVRDNCPACERQLATLLQNGAPLDIWLADSNGNDEKLRRWAQRHHIDPERVRERSLTLNHGTAQWRQRGFASLPLRLDHQEATWHTASSP